jgi:NAD(P)-dependent dehydrogenase (short-subunit alcohol dehydrogenase family)
VNLIGQLAVTQALLPSLRRAQGRIVMVSTIGVRFTPPFAGSLDATKAALTALADTRRQELAPAHLRAAGPRLRRHPVLKLIDIPHLLR